MFRLYIALWRRDVAIRKLGRHRAESFQSELWKWKEIKIEQRIVRWQAIAKNLAPQMSDFTWKFSATE